MIPPEPGPDPPEPEPTTYKLNCTCSYATSYYGVSLRFTLSYKSTADAAWTQCDTHDFTSGTSGGDPVLISMENIPSGSHSVKLELASLNSGYYADMKNNPNSQWVTELTYGSGNDGWVYDYDTNINIMVGTLGGGGGGA